MRVEPRPEPAAFDGTVRKPGLSAISELVGQGPLPGQGRLGPAATFPGRESIPGRHLPAHWSGARADLLREYARTCAFSGLRPSRPWTEDRYLTIDHMVPKSRDCRLAYEWSNLRLACRILNQRKGNSEDVLDPFEIDVDGEAWFHMDTVEFRLRPNPDLDSGLQARIRHAISTLGLNGPAWRATRREHYAQFEKHGQLCRVERAFPFVAREIRRLGTEPTPPRETGPDA